jgi:acyl carrier protein|tara:strand:- start:7 stop:231 length:225 start_codon:yes stop_codon:yes gene_type:complete
MSEIVYKIIKDILTDDVEKIKPEAKLIDDLGADSLTAVEIVMEIEKELGVDIDDSEVEKIVTVQDVINIVESKK